MKGLRVAAATLGCKVNQVETAALLEGFAAQGSCIVSFKDQADFYLVNTCAVTARATYESRQLFRRALRRRPKLVVGTGCYVQIAPEEILGGVEGPVFLVGNDRKHEIPRLVSRLPLPLSESQVLVGDISSERRCVPFLVRRFFDHSRAFARVQDGCNAFCKYCVVPYARGPARSLPLELVLKQVRLFKEEGYQEVVLTGTHLGLWGRDLEPPLTLVDLLRALEALLPPRLRLSSLEPQEVSPALLSWAHGSPYFCPHFHLSLQSGDDEILKAMGRTYTSAEIETLVREIKSLFPEAAIGMDVIAGFPGESEEAFARTYALLERLPVSYLHVFPYSPRPFTEAAKWSQVPPDRIAARARRLKELSLAKRKAFCLENLGHVRHVLVQKRDPRTGLYRGLSENYLTVFFEGPEGLEGRIVPVRLERLVNDTLYGLLVGQRPEQTVYFAQSAVR